jgi:hypothetical protein
VFDIDGINYSSSKVNTGTNANEEYQAWCGDCVCYLCGQWDTNYGNTNYGGDGRSTGQVGMKGIFTRNGLNYMDLSFSGVGPTEPASDTSTADGSYGNLKDQKHKLDWRVGDPNNSDTDRRECRDR